MSPAAVRHNLQTDHAIRYAGALCSIAKRAADGYCAASTARTHTRAMWNKIDAEGLRARVEDALPTVRARAEYQQGAR
jgi:hypothetical protein